MILDHSISRGEESWFKYSQRPFEIRVKFLETALMLPSTRVIQNRVFQVEALILGWLSMLSSAVMNN